MFVRIGEAVLTAVATYAAIRLIELIWDGRANSSSK